MRKRRRFRNLSLSKKIMLVMTAVIVCLSLFLGLFSWQLADSAFSQLALKLYRRSLENVCAQLDADINAAQDMMTQVSRLSSLRTLSAETLPPQETVDSCTMSLLSSVNSLISISASRSAAPVTFLSVCMKNGYTLSSNTGITLPYRDFEECCTFLLENGVDTLDSYVPTTWIDCTVQPFRSVPTRSIVGMRFIYDGVTLEKTGVMIIGLNEPKIMSICEMVSSDAMLVRPDGFVLSAAGTSADGLGTLLSDSGTQPVTLPDGRAALIHRVFSGSLYMVAPLDQASMEDGSVAIHYLKQTVLLCICALAAAIVVIWLCSRGLTHSLVELKQVVRKVYDGDLDARFHSDQHDEIAYLGNRINDMLEQVQDFFHTQERDAVEKRDLELRLMQSQINPHLLYNTLTSIAWCIRQDDPGKAERLLLSLGSFFKLALSSGNDMVPLEDELNMIRHYLQVQNLGRGKDYVFCDNVPDSLRSVRILHLSLQPFVENAVIHGFSNYMDDGCITVSARTDRAAQTICITVEDDGIGILPEDLEKLLTAIHTYPPRGDQAHFGLYNVDRRIKNKFGSTFGVRIESEVGRYTRASILLPYKEEA